MIDQLDWNKSDGLLPAIVQDSDSKDILMLGYMNQESLEVTQKLGLVTFFSRSKQRLWTKGESSGNTLQLIDIKQDCDSDTILVTARPAGPVCHTGSRTCFGEGASNGYEFLPTLWKIIAERFENKPEGSYITHLMNKGLHKMAQKVGEEGVEVALAAKDDDREEFLGEAADLLFHLMVLLKAKDCQVTDVLEVLRKRHDESH